MRFDCDWIDAEDDAEENSVGQECEKVREYEGVDGECRSARLFTVLWVRVSTRKSLENEKSEKDNLGQGKRFNANTEENERMGACAPEAVDGDGDQVQVQRGRVV